MRLTIVTLALLAQGEQAIANVVFGRTQTTTACPAEKCFSAIKLKSSLTKPASSFCSSFIKFTPATSTSTITTTSTSTSVSTVNATPAQVTSTSTSTVTPPPVIISTDSVCATSTATSPGPFTTTNVGYASRASMPGGNNNKRAATANSNSFTAPNCGSGKGLAAKISSACSCFLGPQTTTVKVTTTAHKTIVQTTTNTVPAVTTTVTVSTTLKPSTSTQCQTSTTTSIVAKASGQTCGVLISAYTTGANIECSAASTTAGSEPQATNAKFRIEGDDTEGTIFDGPCIASGPRTLRTDQGGSHLCDGTLDNANPAPGGTLLTQVDAAGDLNGFDFDGPYYANYGGFSINRIGSSTTTGGIISWGNLRDYVIPPGGACETYSSPGEGLWVYDAFNKAGFYQLVPEYAVMRPGEQVTLTVISHDGYGGAPSPAEGATVGNQYRSDQNGNVVLTAPSSVGCYKYKAQNGSYARSNAFWLTVAEDL